MNMYFQQKCKNNTQYFDDSEKIGTDKCCQLLHNEAYVDSRCDGPLQVEQGGAGGGPLHHVPANSDREPSTLPHPLTLRRDPAGRALNET